MLPSTAKLASQQPKNTVQTRTSLQQSSPSHTVKVFMAICQNTPLAHLGATALRSLASHATSQVSCRHLVNCRGKPGVTVLKIFFSSFCAIAFGVCVFTQNGPLEKQYCVSNVQLGTSNCSIVCAQPYSLESYSPLFCSLFFVMDTGPRLPPVDSRVCYAVASAFTVPS